MSYSDFFIRLERKFLRNICSNTEIAESPQICTLEKYYETYKKFVKICVGLLLLTSNKVHSNQGDLFDANVRDFLDEKHPDIKIDELRSKIDKAELKSLIKETVWKILNFNLKLYAFVYDSLIDFPASSDITFDTITTNNFLKNVHKMIKVKVHLHHSHVTGKIFGYPQEFCNWRIRENKYEIPLIVHNLFGFDMFFF